MTKPSLLTKIREGAHHYWMGTKLLVYEVRISSKLLAKVLKGQPLIRREYRQLVRTTGDLLRLVPFIIILIVPFLEFALPVLLKLFPNMLPSTFEDRLKNEENIKKQLKVKLETAKFLQDMTESLAESDHGAKNLKELFEKAKSQGGSLSAKEVVEVCRGIGDEVTLENLQRPQLLTLCRYMSIRAFGTDNFLRYQIRRAIEKLKQDDAMINNEGVDSLTHEELKSACNARGIRSIDVTDEYMKRELQQWIDLQLHHSVPAPLLVLSRAFALTAFDGVEALRATVSSLPTEIVEEAGGTEADVSDAEVKLKLLRRQEDLIKTELEQERSAATTDTTKLTNKEIESLSEAVVTLASESPAVIEKGELKEIIEEHQEHLEVSREDSRNATNLLKKQLDLLIEDISEDIDRFEAEVGKRLQIISASYDGSISAGQLRAVFNLVKNSPKDAAKMAEALRTFDADQDGKIFIDDLIKLAEEAEEREGHGVVDNSEKPK